MIPLTKLKKDVQFNQDLTKVVDVMKGIATAKYHLLEKRLALFKEYFEVAGEFLTILDPSRAQHPFAQVQTPVMGVILVTSDAGFLGGLNAQVVNLGVSEAGPNAVISVIGERGVYYLRDAKQSVTAFPGIQDDECQRMSLALQIRDHMVQQVLDGKCGRLIVVYPKPVSFTVQELTIEPLLPCTAWMPKAPAVSPYLIWESPMEGVLEYVVMQWIALRLSEIFAMARLAEMAARAVHLEGSFQELQRRGKKLKHQYLRARHEVIDRSIREVCVAQMLNGKQAEPA